MKKSMKCLFSMLLVMLLLFSSVPLTGLDDSVRSAFEIAANAAETFTDGRYSYTVTDGKATITSRTSYDDLDVVDFQNLTVPAELGGYPVVAIGEHVFWYSDYVNVVIPEGIVSIGSEAFRGCQSLQSVIIPEGVVNIESLAFFDCESLQSIKLPQTLESIGSSAFMYCDALTEVTIPASVTNIGDRAFNGCEKLERINVDAANEHYSNDSYGVLFNKDKTELIQYPAGPTRTSYTIPSTVHTLRDQSFERADFLVTVIIPNSVTHIGDSVFNGCDSLKEAKIPSSVTSIGDGAFSWSNAGIEEIYVPSSVTHIGIGTFSMRDLERIIVDPANQYYCSDENGVLFNKDKTELMIYPVGRDAEAYTVPDTVTTIKDSAFRHTYWLSITLPDSVVKIEKNAFSYSDIYEIMIPDSVVAIGERAFYDCRNLDSVVIPDSVTRIERSTFWRCEDLESITIPNSVTYIGDSAFQYADSLTDVYFGGSEKEWNNISIREYNDALEDANIHFSYTASGTVRNKNADQRIEITPKDASGSWIDDTSSLNGFLGNAFEKIADVNIKSALGESTISGSFSAAKNDIKGQDIVLSKIDYFDYIIPAAVIASWSTPNGAEYSFDAMMHKDRKNGKPYVSTVFGRVAGKSADEYAELTASKLTVHANERYDIIISAGNIGAGTKYYLAQDASRKLESTTGVFSSADLYATFSQGKKIYAYVVSSGEVSDLADLSIELAASLPVSVGTALKNSTLSLIGTGAQGFSVSDNVPIIGGLTIGMDMFTFPIGVDVTDSKVRLSLGFDAFSYQTSGTVGGKQNKESEWMDLKKEIKGISDNLKGSKDAWKDYNKLLRNKGVKDRMKSSYGFNVGVLGYVEIDTANGASITDAYVSVNGEFSLSLTQQFAAFVVPLYLSTTAKAELGMETQRVVIGNDPSLPFEFNLTLNMTPSLQISGGAGVKNAASVGVYGKGSLPFTNNFATKYRRFAVEGELGLEAEFFLLKAELPLLNGEFVVYDGYYNSSRMYSLLKNNRIGFGGSMPKATLTTVSRDYVEEMSEWMGEYPVSVFSLADKGVSFNVLQTGIFSQTEPQLVAFGEKLMMVWVQDDTARDEFNRMRLVYSLYNAQNGTWSEPQAVYDDGKNDAYPALASDGENVYVAWQKINKTVMAEEMSDATVFLKNSEIFVAKYDAVNDCFVDATQLTDNELYDYMPSLVVNNGEVAVYYAQGGENINTTAANNTLFRQQPGNTAQVIAENLNYVITAVPRIVNGNETLSYSVDSDGDTATSDDIVVYTVSDADVTMFGKDSDNGAYTFADYAVVDGDETLFVSDLTNIYYEVDGEVRTVFEEARLMEGNILFVQDPNRLSVLWTESNKVGGNDLWTTSYEDGAWSLPVQISDVEQFRLSEIDVAMLGGRLIGICNMQEMQFDEESGTYTAGVANLCSFTAKEFSDIALDIYYVDESKMIPGQTAEIDVYVNNYGTTAVDKITFTVSDSLGNRSTVSETVDLKAGDTIVVPVKYNVPKNYRATTLTVSATIPGVTETDTDDNKARIAIGKCDLAVMNTDVIDVGDGYVIKAVVENNSFVTAKQVVISTMCNTPDAYAAQQYTAEQITNEQYVDFQFAINKSSIAFDENGIGKVYITVSSAKEDAADGDNTACVSVTLPQNTECAHPLMEVIPAKDATCSEVGYCEHLACAVCHEKEDNYVEYPMLPHTDSSEDGLCAECEARLYYIIEENSGDSVPAGQGETVYLKFVPAEDGDYVFSSYNYEPATGYLFDENKNLIASDSKDNGFYLIASLQGGHVYYWGMSFVDEETDGTLSYYLDRCEHPYTIRYYQQSATCTEAGYTAGLRCMYCNKWVEGHEYIVPLGHDFSSEFTIDKPATSDEPGSKSRHCLRYGCNEKTDVTEIPKSDKLFVDSDKAVLDGTNIIAVAGVTAQQILAQAGADAVIRDAQNNEVAADKPVATGMKITLSGANECTVVVAGDIDGDSLISSSDARLALRTAVGLENYAEDSAERKAANVDNETGISSSDARLILRAAVGLEDPKEWMK